MYLLLINQGLIISIVFISLNLGLLCMILALGESVCKVIKRMLQNSSNDLNQLGIGSQKLQGSPIISWYLQALIRPSQSSKGEEEDIIAAPIQAVGMFMCCMTCTRAHRTCEEQLPKEERDPGALLLRTVTCRLWKVTWRNGCLNLGNGAG